MLMFTFSVLDQNNLFSDKFGPKNQKLFRLKFGIKPNSNMLNVMVVFTCFFKTLKTLYQQT